MDVFTTNKKGKSICNENAQKGGRNKQTNAKLVLPESKVRMRSNGDGMWCDLLREPHNLDFHSWS
jgi:hypothetical protein